MNFIIKVILSGILFVQFSFAETVLFYQKPGVKNAVEYLNTQPTLDDVAKTIAFGAMDAKLLVTIRKKLKEKGLAATTRMPSTELKGNKLTIEGLEHPLIISNSEKLEISYNGEIIPLKNVKDVEQTFKDIESFFGRSGKSVKYIFLKMSIGEDAYALPVVIYLIAMGVLFLGFEAYKWWTKKSKEGLNDWPFDVSNFGKPIDFKCESGRFVILCGNEKLSFYSNESGHNVDYADTKKTSRVGTLTLVPDVEIPKGNGVFKDAFYEPAQKTAILNMAKTVLGENGQRQLCDGSEFADNMGQQFAEIARTATGQSQRKDKPGTVNTLKNLDSGSRSK